MVENNARQESVTVKKIETKKKPLRIIDCRGFWYPVPESNWYILRY